jgi:hypothetical protein
MLNFTMKIMKDMKGMPLRSLAKKWIQLHKLGERDRSAALPLVNGLVFMLFMSL